MRDVPSFPMHGIIARASWYPSVVLPQFYIRPTTANPPVQPAVQYSIRSLEWGLPTRWRLSAGISVERYSAPAGWCAPTRVRSGKRSKARSCLPGRSYLFGAPSCPTRIGRYISELGNTGFDGTPEYLAEGVSLDIPTAHGQKLTTLLAQLSGGTIRPEHLRRGGSRASMGRDF